MFRSLNVTEFILGCQYISVTCDKFHLYGKPQFKGQGPVNLRIQGSLLQLQAIESETFFSQLRFSSLHKF